MNRLLLCLCAAAFIATPLCAQTTRPTTAPIDSRLLNELHAIDKQVSQIHDLQADFVQKKQTPLLKKPLISSGTLLLKGSRTLWKTTQPEPSDMLIDPKEIRIYFPREKSMEIYPVQGRMGALAASPLPRLNLLREFFSFQRIGPHDLSDDASPDAYLALQLTPLDPTLAEHLTSVRVLINRQTGLIQSAQTLDPAGDRTTLTFSNIRTNTGLSDDQLRLDVPEDTKISHPLEGLNPSN